MGREKSITRRKKATGKILSPFVLSDCQQSIELNRINVPNVVRVVLDGTIRAELTCVADISPALFCECVLILVVAVELELGVHVALEVIHQEVLIRMALTPIDVVDNGIVQLLEHAGAAIVQRAVYKSFHDALDLRVVVVEIGRAHV